MHRETSFDCSNVATTLQDERASCGSDNEGQWNGEAESARPQRSEDGRNAAEPSAGTPDINNMGVPSRGEGDKRLYVGSIDTLHLSCYVDWQERAEALWKVLEKAQACARDEEDKLGRFIQLSGLTIEVLAMGSGGNGSPYRPFVVICGGIRLEFSRLGFPKNETPNVRAVMGSVLCMSYGPLDLFEQLRNIIAALGGNLFKHKISRIDGAVDLPDVGADYFAKRYADGHFITRLKKGAIRKEGTELTGMEIGGASRIRIYDKVRELTVKPDSDKWELLIVRWKGEIPRKAARVEFQCDRDFVRSFKGPNGEVMNTLQQYAQWAGSFWGYCCTKWVRCADRPVNRDNTESEKVDAVWKKVQESFMAFGGNEEVARTETKGANCKVLAQQATGCLVAAVVADMGREPTVEEFVDRAIVLVRETIADLGVKEFRKRLKAAYLSHLAGVEGIAMFAPAPDPTLWAYNEEAVRYNSQLERERAVDKDPDQRKLAGIGVE